ncbi:hypothetical protein [Tahibacter harae]|uniref:Uncharacterized protein n=1 Tax=Tahibacter harae TaxID=2963937 RepID=A0ABT1QV32_9GAMM|nr:hypothetical protein [Tahibacter harae]MCQ4166142.1 hypothetical protein [Tahibacter harae]
MNTRTLDLDQLRQQWTAQGRELDAHLQLDVNAVRRRLAAGTATALQRQKLRRGLALLAGAGLLAALLAFMTAHTGDPPYLLLALPLALLTLFAGSVDAREWLVLRQIDFAQPLARLRTQYDELRARRLQLARLIAQLSVLLWLPMILVAVKGLAGVDLLRRLPPSVILVNLSLGLIAIPLLGAVTRWAASRWPQSTALRRFGDSVAGGDWQHTSAQLDRQLDFEHDLASAPLHAVRRAAAAPLPAAVEALRRSACRRSDLGIAAICVLILGGGVFNAQHGSSASALIPGIVLHLLAVGWLIAAIQQRDALAAPDAGDASSWRERLGRALHRREVLLQSYVVALPLLSLALLQVLGLALAAADLWQLLGLATWLGLGVPALIASVLLYRHWRRAAPHFAARLVEALSLGSLHRAKAVIRASSAADDDAAQREAA